MRTFFIGLAMSMAGASLLAPAVPAAATAAAERLPTGDGSFVFTGWQGPAITVFTHLPTTVTADTPIVFVMHGRGRDAERYRKEWAGLADANKFILITPQFDKAAFPDTQMYNHGGFRNADGSLRPRAQWTFSAIEPMFDAVKARTGSKVARYAIYGHSAGAQFVHRYVLLVPHPRISAAVSANAGSYAWPSFEKDYPFGLRGAPVDNAQLKRAFATPLVVLLGTADIDPNSESLPRDPAAMEQGPYRLARGKAFYTAAEAKAKELGVPFRWRLRYADGIAHSDGGMAAFAAPLLAEGFGAK